jgi:hypothetical protein
VSTTTLHAVRPRCRHGRFLAAGTDTCHCGQPTTEAPARPLARRHVRTPVSVPEAAACHAAMAARVMAWRGHADGTATATLPDGTHIRYQPHQRVPFAVAVPCLLGAHHYQSIRSLTDLDLARVDAAACITLHEDFTDWATAAARDLSAAFAPRRIPGTPAVVPLFARADMPGGER